MHAPYPDTGSASVAIRARIGVRDMLLALAASLALALVAAGGAVHAQTQVRTVEGVVQNATSDGGSVSEQTVTLHRVTSTGFDDLTTTTDGAGAFSFSDFEFNPDVSYGVSVRYQDAIYGTDLDLAGGSPEPVILTVYDGTSDDGIVSAISASLLLADADPSDQTLAALEIIRLVNRSGRAYVPGEGVMELLRFGLPPGATDLVLDTALIGADYVQVDRGFALLASVPPGRARSDVLVQISLRGIQDHIGEVVQVRRRQGANSRPRGSCIDHQRLARRTQPGHHWGTSVPGRGGGGV